MERNERESEPSESRAADRSPRSRRLTAILSKKPAPGRVKTRLCPPLTPEQAASLAEGMLADAVERCAASEQFRTVLVFSPASESRWFRKRFPQLADQRPQRGRGLGERLASLFDDALADEQVSTVVAIGSDQPLVSTDTIAAAHARLERDADLVLGPDGGGGYSLVGLRRPCSELFTSVTMSRVDMFDATLAVASRHGLSVCLLEAAYDVDVATDLDRLCRDLHALSPDAPEFPRHTAQRLRALPSPPRQET